MINVTDEIKQAYDVSTTQIDKIVLDGKEYRITNVEYYDDTYEEGNIFGTAIARCLEFEIENIVDLENKEIEYLTGIVINGQTQWISLGNFIIQEVEPNDTTNINIVTAMDYMLKSNIEYKTNLDYSNGKITILQVLQEVCNNSGLTLATTDFANKDFIVDSNQFAEGTLNRQVIQAVAQISGTVAKIKNNNKLYLINPNKITTTSKIFTLNNYEEAEIKRNTHPINLVSLAMKDVEGENITLRDEESITKNGENSLVINDNPFAYTQAKREQLITDLFNAVKGFEYKAYSFSCQGIPYSETLDKIQFYDKEGNVYDSYLFRFNYKSPNGLESTIEAPSIIKATVNYQNIPSALDIAKRTEIIVDKQNETITSVVERQDEQGQKITQQEQTIEGIETSVSNVETKVEQVQEQANINTDEIAKLGATETVEGTYLTVDASNNPAKLYVYGNTEQETSIQGKNKLDLGQDSYSRLGVNINLKGSKLSVNGTVTTSGNFFNTDEIVVDYIHLGKFTAGTYRFSKFISSGNYTIDSNAGAGTFACYIRKSDKTSLANIGSSASSGSGITITLEEDTDLYIQIWCNVGAVFDNYVLDFQLEEGNTTTELEDFVPNMPSPKYPSDIRNVGDNINLFDKNTIIKTGKYHMNGSELTNSKYFYNKVRVKGINKLSYNGCKYSSGSNVVIFDFYDNNDTFISCAWYKTTSDIVSVPDNATYCYFSYLYSEIDTIKIEEGTIATSYSEYGCGSVDLKVSNKNLFDLGKRTQSSLLGVVIDIDGSEITLNGTTTGYGNLIQQYGDIASYAYIGKFKAGTYYVNRDYISGTYTTTGASSCYIRDKNKKEIFNLGIQNARGTKITLTEDTDLYLQVYCNIAGTVFDNYKISFQMEKGEKKTQYEKHQSRIYSFPFAEGQLLHKGDYLAQDGIHQIRKTIELTGTENWKLGVSPSTGYIRPYYKKEDSFKNCNISSNIYTSVDYNDRNSKYDNTIYSDGNIAMNTNVATTLDEFKTFLAEQYANGTPVIVEYELAEEIVIPYTPEQQKVLDSIETFKGINHIYCIDEITPERMILTYYPNTPYNDTLVNKDTFDKVTTEMNAEFNIRANEVETTVREQTTASIMTLLNNNYLTGEQVNALVEGNAEDIATVKEQLTQTVTSSQMQIEITKAIEGGVSYLKNTLFTIDENGMWIATSEDAFNALYNNKGMYLYSYEEMIAKFDIAGTTIQGNMTLEGEFITPNLRMMNVDVSGVPHTHIHWIGG